VRRIQGRTAAGSAGGGEQRPRHPSRASRVIVQIAQRQQGAAEGKDESGEESSLAALSPASRQEECADTGQREVHDVKQRVSENDRKKDDDEHVGIEEQEVWVLKQGLAAVQVRIPIGQFAVPAHLLNEAGAGIGVIGDVAKEKHGRSKDHLPKQGQRAEREDGRQRQINAVKRLPNSHGGV
jgi:hypothetical protein